MRVDEVGGGKRRGGVEEGAGGASEAEPSEVCVIEIRAPLGLRLGFSSVFSRSSRRFAFFLCVWL